MDYENPFDDFDQGEITAMLEDYNARGEEGQKAINNIIDIANEHFKRYSSSISKKYDIDLSTSELLQSGYLKMLSSENYQFESRGHFLAVMKLTFKSLAIDKLRGYKRQSALKDAFKVHVGPEERDFFSTRELVLFNEILKLLEEDNPNHHLAFINSHFLGFDNRTLAEELGLEVSTIARWLRRANGFVKARLQEGMNK